MPLRIHSLSPVAGLAVLLTAFLPLGCAPQTGDVRMTATSAAAGRQAFAQSTDWSGESGASGHPQMTAAAIRDAAANFEQCLARLAAEAERRGISRVTYQTHTRGLTPDLKIMDLVDAQPEFTKSFWEYLDLRSARADCARAKSCAPSRELRHRGKDTAWTVTSSRRSGASNRNTPP